MHCPKSKHELFLFMATLFFFTASLAYPQGVCSRPSKQPRLIPLRGLNLWGGRAMLKSFFFLLAVVGQWIIDTGGKTDRALGGVAEPDLVSKMAFPRRG